MIERAAPLYPNYVRRRKLPRSSSWCGAVLFFTALSLLNYDLIAFEVTILTINWIVLIVSGVLLSIVFRRAARGDSVSARAVWIAKLRDHDKWWFRARTL